MCNYNKPTKIIGITTNVIVICVKKFYSRIFEKGVATFEFRNLVWLIKLLIFFLHFIFIKQLSLYWLYRTWRKHAHFLKYFCFYFINVIIPGKQCFYNWKLTICRFSGVTMPCWSKKFMFQYLFFRKLRRKFIPMKRISARFSSSKNLSEYAKREAE